MEQQAPMVKVKLMQHQAVQMEETQVAIGILFVVQVLVLVLLELME
jgi:hypothetical protein